MDILSAMKGMAPPPRSAFYSEMREPIDQAVQLFSDAMTTVRTGVERLLEILSETKPEFEKWVRSRNGAAAAF